MQYIYNPSEFRVPTTVSFDTEYSALNIRKAELLSVSIGISEDLTYVFDPTELNTVEYILTRAKQLYTWNMTVDWYMLSKYGIRLNCDKILDGMLMEHLIDENLPHGLGDFALRRYNDNYKDEFWSTYESYSQAPRDAACDYEMRDGCYTYRACKEYSKHLETRWPLVEHVHRLQWALFETEIAGIKVNMDLLQSTEHETRHKIKELLPRLRKDFYDEVYVWEDREYQREVEARKTTEGKSRVRRPEFNFASDHQLRWLVYDTLGCPVYEVTKKKAPKLDYETLLQLSQEFPRLSSLVEYKSVKSLHKNFMEGILKRVEDGRIYPGFYINGTATGRISHNNPNMGNLPKDGVIRNFFIPDEGNVIVGADYSQLEVVVEANLTEDPQLLKIILEGASKHDITASGLGLSRETAKTLNFALQYGAGVFKISKILGVSNTDSEEIFERYWKLYAGVKALKDATAKELEQKGYVTNLFGRTRHFPKPLSEFERAKQERQAYNFKIQGVGADITNRATYLIHEVFKESGLGRLWFSVHDEIVTECLPGSIDWTIDMIQTQMDEPNKYLNLKYPVQSKSYGPFACWKKA